MDKVEKARKAISKAKFTMMRKEWRDKCRFFSALLSQLRIVIDERCPTAATNGKTLWYNPDFVLSLTKDELVFLTMHELGHVIYEHVTIGKKHKLDAKLHNIAGDHYINLWLIKHGFVMPLVKDGPDKGQMLGYADPKYKGMSTMQIYRDLQANPPPQSEMDEFHIDIVQADEDSDNSDSVSATTAVQEIKAKIMQAAIAVQMTDSWGMVPADIRIAIERMQSPELAWDEILAEYMANWSKDDFSMHRPNRRFIHSGIYLPSLHSPALGPAMFVVDVSGSMYGEAVSKAWAAMVGFFETHKPEWMHLLTFDTKIQQDKKYYPGDDTDDIKFTGGGGTHLRMVEKRMRQEQPEYCIIMTDGFVQVPAFENIDTDIIWIIVDGDRNFQASRDRDRVIFIEE